MAININIVNPSDLQVDQAQSGQNNRDKSAKDQGCNQLPSKKFLLDVGYKPALLSISGFQ